MSEEEEEEGEMVWEIAGFLSLEGVEEGEEREEEEGWSTMSLNRPTVACFFFFFLNK